MSTTYDKCHWILCFKCLTIFASKQLLKKLNIIENCCDNGIVETTTVKENLVR